MDGLENVFDEELDFGLPEVVEENNEFTRTDDDLFGYSSDNEEKPKDVSVIDDFLKINGINDGKIKLIDENNQEKESSFYELSKQEQLDILNSFAEANKTNLNKSEEDFLGYLKTNNLTVDNFLAQYKDNIVKELSSQYEPNYEIDAYDDQELFLLDLKSKYDLTDEELTSELTKELLNEPLFKKKVDSLRLEYKKLEDKHKENQQLEFTKQREEEYNRFADTLVDVAVKNSGFYDIELEDNEKNEVLSFLLDLDDNGTSNFYKELNKPEKLYEAAWFLKYGKDAFNALRTAYESEIAKIKKDIKPNVVIRNNTQQSGERSIHDLSF